MSELAVERVKALKGPANRRAKILITGRELASLLDLPSGLTVRHVTALWDPDAVAIVVEGDSLEETLEECEAPILAGFWDRRQIIGPDGQRYVRWGWMQDAPACDPSSPATHCGRSDCTDHGCGKA